MSTTQLETRTEEKVRREITAYQIILGFATIGTFATVIGLVIAVVLLTRPAVTFKLDTLEVHTLEVCPGSDFRASVYMESTSTPITVFLAQNWYNVDTDQAFVADGVTGVTFPEGREGTTFAITAKVPEALEPGHWEFWTGAGNSRATALRIPITILSQGACNGSSQ